MLRLLEVQKAALTRHIRSQHAAPDITRGRRRAQKERKSKGIRPLPRANPVFDKGGRTWQAANSVHAMRATHLAPTFRSSCPVAAPIFHELRKVMGTSKPITPVPLFDLKFLDQIRRLHRRNFKSAALAASFKGECQIQNSTRIDICWWSFDSNIRKTACRDGMRMLESDH